MQITSPTSSPAQDFTISTQLLVPPGAGSTTGGVHLAQVQHVVSMHSWTAGTLDNTHGPIGGWDMHPIGAKAGAALQQQAEAFVASHPSSDSDIPAPGETVMTIITGDDAHSYVAKDAAAQALATALDAIAGPATH